MRGMDAQSFLRCVALCSSLFRFPRDSCTVYQDISNELLDMATGDAEFVSQTAKLRILDVNSKRIALMRDSYTFKLFLRVSSQSLLIYYTF